MHLLCNLAKMYNQNNQKNWMIEQLNEQMQSKHVHLLL